MFYGDSINLSNSIDIFPKEVVDKWLSTEDLVYFKKGELIISPNSYSKHIYIILEGQANIFNIHKDGKECVIGILSRGDFIYMANIFSDYNRTIISKALTDVKLARIEKSELRSMVVNRPEISYEFLRLFSSKINELTEILSQVAYGKVEERLVFLLKKLCLEEDSMEGWAPISLSITHQDLAGMVGSTRETITLLINKLIDQGLLRVQDKKLWIFLK